MLKFFGGLVVACMAAQFASSNWCNLENCLGAEHIDCKMYDKGFADDCPEDATVLFMHHHRDFLLDKMNGLRNKIAGGEVDGFEPATRMATLRYNNSLANLAIRNARQCKMKHDACRNTPDFFLVGQNIAKASFPKNHTLALEDVLSAMIDAWWEQSSSATQADINELGSSADINDIGHFTQLATMSASRVGCGCVLFSEADQKTVLFTCNFDLGNARARPVYEKGLTASGCLNGTNPDYPNLCGFFERYFVNQPFGPPTFKRIQRHRMIRK